MKRQLTLGEYRTIDLVLFALLLIFFEFIILRVAATTFFTVSLAAAITTIVYMRWGWWGAIHAALSGLLFCFYYSSGAAPDQTVGPAQYAIYIVGNLFSLAAVPVLKKLGPQRVRESAVKSLLFALAVVLLMQGGRGAVALALGTVPFSGALGYFTTDSLSVLFTLVIIWIVRRLDGVFEEQRHYLLRIQEEKERHNTDL